MKKFLFLLFAISLLSSSCVRFWGKRVRGNGNIVTEERSVSSFDRVEVHGAIDVYVSQGEAKPVKLEGDENLLRYVEVEDHGSKLVIKTRPGFNLSPTHKFKVYVSAPSYRSLEVTGACNIIGENKISGNESLDLAVSGAGDIRMEVEAPGVKADITGSGNVDLKGRTRDFDLDLSGAAKATCFDLLSENTSVDISGAGSAEVYASVKLDAEVSGAGSVRYKGNATQIDQHVSGAGSVKKSD